MSKEYYSTIEAANILRVSRITIFNWIKKGKIKATKIGRNYIISHDSLVEKLGKTLGIEKKAEIEGSIDRAMKDFEPTFRKLGKE